MQNYVEDMKTPTNIREEYLLECKEFLTYFGKDFSGDFITLNSGDLSCIMNPKSPWYKKFGGKSIWAIADFVAKELGKKIKWDEEDYIGKNLIF